MLNIGYKYVEGVVCLWRSYEIADFIISWSYCSWRVLHIWRSYRIRGDSIFRFILSLKSYTHFEDYMNCDTILPTSSSKFFELTEIMWIRQSFYEFIEIRLKCRKSMNSGVFYELIDFLWFHRISMQSSNFYDVTMQFQSKMMRASPRSWRPVTHQWMHGPLVHVHVCTYVCIYIYIYT